MDIRTVDLISYTITSLKPNLQIEEAAPGSGDVCGSTFVNRIFANHLQRRFEGDLDWNQDPLIRAEALEYFETVVKTSFDGHRDFLVPVHGVGPRRGVNRGRLEVTASDLKGIFEPVIREVLRLINDQVQQTARAVKLILLVGGFGSSPYLRKCIREKFPNTEVKMAQNSYVQASPSIFVELIKVLTLDSEKRRS